MTDPASHTLTVGDDGPSATGPNPEAACLFVLVECSRLAGLPARHSLRGVSTVRLGRGARRDIERTGGELALKIPDQWMSSRHAQLRSAYGRWLIEDLGSKNGTLVNGEPTGQKELRDGDIIETGHTLLMFRAAVAADGEADLMVDPDAGPLGLATLLPTYQNVLTDLRRIAASSVRVLLLGETGTGKEVLARAIHQLSARSGEFIAVNCGALPQNLVESELFGHKKGAFSGADSDRKGLVRAADAGTLFLDEIGDLPAASQAALLRVLQEGEVVPVGATKPVPVDIRLVAATHRDLDRMLDSGEFRRDLYARISGYRMTLPPLRERREDIGFLLSSMLRTKVEGGACEIDTQAALQLIAYDWPLNIRELDSALQTAVVLADGAAIDPSHLPAAVRDGAPPPAASTPAGELAELSEADRELRTQLVAELDRHGGNVSAVARTMGKDRKQIQRWVKRLQIDLHSFRRG